MSTPASGVIGSPFRLAVPIRFGDCDPAGILYYPRYFDLFHQAMEAWFDGALGLPYATFLNEHRLGLPAVHATANYRAPSTFGEMVTVELRVLALGTTSIRFGYRVLGPDQAERASGETVCVVLDLDPSSPTARCAVPIPSDLRDLIGQTARPSATLT